MFNHVAMVAQETPTVEANPGGLITIRNYDYDADKGVTLMLHPDEAFALIVRLAQGLAVQATTEEEG